MLPPIYLDCNATTPLLPVARAAMLDWLDEGRPANPGSRTHAYGSEALKALNRARLAVAAVVDLPPGGVVFTSGATEANNLAVLGLARHGRATGRLHLVTTAIEHAAVLEPMERLEMEGFEVTRVAPDASGRVDPVALEASIRDDTLLVSLMQVNNETGVVQAVTEVAELLRRHEAFLHVDASQGFTKELESLRHPRVDLMSVSAHKVGGPVGVGALLCRKRAYRMPPIEALASGGGQERGLRPGTVAIAPIAAFGVAAAWQVQEHKQWLARCKMYRQHVMEGLANLGSGFDVNHDLDHSLPNCLNVSFRDACGGWLDGEAVLLALRKHLAASNGSACTSSRGMKLSHVLEAQDLPEPRRRGAVRLSWCERTAHVDWTAARNDFQRLL